jgi:hypothetical protein
MYVICYNSLIFLFSEINLSVYVLFQPSMPPAAPIIQEVGPLQAKALQKQKEQKEKEAKAAAASGNTGTIDSKKVVKKSTVGSSTEVENEEERVQRVNSTFFM